MGSSQHPRNSTRAGKTRSVKSIRKPRRKPATPSRTNPSASVVAALTEVRRRLELAEAVAIVTCAALRAQAADSDQEAALVLQRCVVDEIDRQIEEIDSVIVMCRALDGAAP
jgi:hypothetical protein